MFSVALSRGSRLPAVSRHRTSVEPGLSSRTGFRHWVEQPSGRLTPTVMGLTQRKFKSGSGNPQLGWMELRRASRAASSAFNVAVVETSTTPSTRMGRKWRWKAAMASRVGLSR